MELKQLCGHLNTLLDSSQYKDYCPNGLQVEGAAEIKRCATAVSASLETIEQAVEAGVQALIVHHGMFWKGDAFPLVGTKQKKVSLLLEHGISLIAYHLPLDANREVGNNWGAAQDLGWKELEPFGEFDGALIGVKGSLAESMSAEQFQASLESYYGQPAHVAPGGSKKIQRVALISGGAHNSIKEAAEAGVDAFVTGSFDEPVWHIAKEEQVHFFSLGHTSTEKVGPKKLADYLKSHLEVDCHFLDAINPF